MSIEMTPSASPLRNVLHDEYKVFLKRIYRHGHHVVVIVVSGKVSFARTRGGGA